MHTYIHTSLRAGHGRAQPGKLGYIKRVQGGAVWCHGIRARCQAQRPGSDSGTECRSEFRCLPPVLFCSPIAVAVLFAVFGAKDQLFVCRLCAGWFTGKITGYNAEAVKNLNYQFPFEVSYPDGDVEDLSLSEVRASPAATHGQTWAGREGYLVWA